VRKFELSNAISNGWLITYMRKV